MSALEHLIGFLKELEAQIPPAQDRRHVLHWGQYGSDLSGWKDKLCLTLNVHGKPVLIFIEEGDLGKPIPQLVAEVRECFTRARDLERQELLHATTEGNA